MLEMLHLKNVGPAPEMKLEFAPRLNVITGDNGLGKSFILDCAWFALTEVWSQEINSQLTVSGMAHPNKAKSSEIKMVSSEKKRSYYFNRIEQEWFDNSTRPINVINTPLGIVIQNHINGGFSVYDSARHLYRMTSHKIEFPDVFTENEVWNGTTSDRDRILEGLIRDVASWQRENGKTFQQFQTVLEYLSPSELEQLQLGELTRVKLDDRRDIPTIQMPYGESTPVTQASSGIRRIFAFAYTLVWAWREHQLASQIIHQEPQNQLTFLIDEIESHLHPKWQQVIVKALLNVAKALSDELEVQIILTTHSPLVLQSLETVFDAEKDAWFDLDFDTTKKEVVLEKREFFKRGSLNNWVTSEAFDLPSSYTLEAKQVMDEVSEALKTNLSLEQAKVLNDKLLDVLGDIDIFWSRWNMALDQRGLVL
jgi:predicted ATPase